MEDLDEKLAVAGRKTTPFGENDLPFFAGDVVHVQLHEPVPEGSRERLTATVCSGRVLRREKSEVGVGFDRLLGFRQEQLPVVVEQPVERLQDLHESKHDAGTRGT